MSIGIPYQENLKAGTELTVKCPIPTLTEPVLITGTIMWTKELDAYKDYPIICGLKFKELNPKHKWELIHYLYDTWHKKLKKDRRDDAAAVEAPQLMEKLCNTDTIFNVLVSRYAEVKKVEKTIDGIAIIINPARWAEWDRSRRHSYANKMYEVINAIDNKARIIIRDTDGKTLAWMMRNYEGMNYMVVAGGSLSKTDN